MGTLHQSIDKIRIWRFPDSSGRLEKVKRFRCIVIIIAPMIRSWVRDWGETILVKYLLKKLVTEINQPPALEYWHICMERFWSFEALCPDLCLADLHFFFL